MNGNRFDHVTKALGAGMPRRRVIGLVLAGLGTALAHSDRSRAQECHALGEGCDLGDPCCDDLVCTAGFVCAETCGAVDHECGTAADCCLFLDCSPSGACYDTNCSGDGASCNPPGSEGTHQLCCPGFYCHPAGRCVSDDTPSCSVSGDPCFNGDECCEGLGCHAQFHSCIERGGGFLCIDDSDCAEDHACDPTGRCRLAPGTCSEEGGPCSNHFECCGLQLCEDYGDGSGTCGPGICGTADAYCGDAPLGAIPCCDGYQCVEDECFACAVEGEDCAADDDCCDGICCAGACSASECCIDEIDPNARCAAGTTCVEGVCEADGGNCAAESEECATDDTCCEGICCAGWCRTVECCTDDVDPNARCPEGTSCFEGICEASGGTCGSHGDSCTASAECCGELVCGGGACAETIVGSDEEAPMENGGATTLPSTGTGSSVTDNGPIEFGLVAGAAAYLAGQRLRKRATPIPE
jgi:hypothetical protein